MARFRLKLINSRVDDTILIFLGTGNGSGNWLSTLDFEFSSVESVASGWRLGDCDKGSAAGGGEGAAGGEGGAKGGVEGGAAGGGEVDRVVGNDSARGRGGGDIGSGSAGGGDGARSGVGGGDGRGIDGSRGGGGGDVGGGEASDDGASPKGYFFFRRVGGSGWTTGATPVSFARLRVNMPMKGERIRKGKFFFFCVKISVPC